MAVFIILTIPVFLHSWKCSNIYMVMLNKEKPTKKVLFVLCTSFWWNSLEIENIGTSKRRKKIRFHLMQFLQNPTTAVWINYATFKNIVFFSRCLTSFHINKKRHKMQFKTVFVVLYFSIYIKGMTENWQLLDLPLKICSSSSLGTVLHQNRNFFRINHSTKHDENHLSNKIKMDTKSIHWNFLKLLILYYYAIKD